MCCWLPVGRALKNKLTVCSDGSGMCTLSQRRLGPGVEGAAWDHEYPDTESYSHPWFHVSWGFKLGLVSVFIFSWENDIRVDMLVGRGNSHQGSFLVCFSTPSPNYPFEMPQIPSYAGRQALNRGWLRGGGPLVACSILPKSGLVPTCKRPRSILTRLTVPS